MAMTKPHFQGDKEAVITKDVSMFLILYIAHLSWLFWFKLEDKITNTMIYNSLLPNRIFRLSFIILALDWIVVKDYVLD